MKKLIAVLVLIGVLGSFNSCKKLTQEDTSLKVSIYNAFTGEPVQDLDLLLYEAKNATPEKTNTKKSFLLKNGKTNTEGQYDFGTFTSRKPGSWKCVLAFTSDPSNYRLYFGLKDTIVDKGQDNDLVLYTYPLAAGIRLNLTPAPPYPLGDSLKVTFKHSSGDTFTISDSDYFIRQIIGYSDVFMGNYQVTIRKKKGGVLTLETDSFFIHVNEELEYNIQF